MENININNLKYLNSSIKDLAEILEIEKNCFNMPWTYEMYFNSLKNEHTILKHIVYDNKILAFILADLIFDDLFILKIAVLKNYRRQGLALFLLKNMITNNIKKINKIYLEVSVNNTDAINFYIKVGFKTINIRKNYYSNGDDANIMLCSYDNFIKRFSL